MCQTSGVRAAVTCFVAAAALGLGCGGDDPDDWPAERPRIDQVRFVGQSPRDPLGLQFVLDFVDADGDLGGGRLDLSIEGSAAGQIELEELFAGQTPPLSLQATAGELEVLVRLAETPGPNQELSIGFQLEDAAGHRSNEPKTTLAAR